MLYLSVTCRCVAPLLQACDPIEPVSELVVGTLVEVLRLHFKTFASLCSGRRPILRWFSAGTRIRARLLFKWKCSVCLLVISRNRLQHPLSPAGLARGIVALQIQDGKASAGHFCPAVGNYLLSHG